jgi:hypothetical protein
MVNSNLLTVKELAAFVGAKPPPAAPIRRRFAAAARGLTAPEPP